MNNCDIVTFGFIISHKRKSYNKQFVLDVSLDVTDKSGMDFDCKVFFVIIVFFSTCNLLFL